VFPVKRSVNPAVQKTWTIPISIVGGSGIVFCLLGILTRGSFLSWLLRLFGKDIDSWP
jgi:hypothetical protein